MDKKYIWIAIIILVLAAIGANIYTRNKKPPLTTFSSNLAIENANNEATLRKVVVDFGIKLKTVSILGSATDVKSAMEQNYGQYVAPELLLNWENTPASAPGRLTSSPYPDRIEIVTAELQADGSYIVRGNVIEATSTGDADAYPVSLQLEKIEGKWLITSFQGYPAVQNAS